LFYVELEQGHKLTSHPVTFYVKGTVEGKAKHVPLIAKTCT